MLDLHKNMDLVSIFEIKNDFKLASDCKCPNDLEGW